MSNVRTSMTSLRNANLSHANLSNAHLEYAIMSDANLSYANLSGARIYFDSLERANLSYANVSLGDGVQANFNDADLIGARGLDSYDTSWWFQWMNTRCPDGSINFSATGCSGDQLIPLADPHGLGAHHEDAWRDF